MTRSNRRAEEREYRRQLNRMITEHGGPSAMWPDFATLNYAQAEAMFLAGRFGRRDPLFAGSVDFAIDYSMDEWNRCIRTHSVGNLPDEYRTGDRKWKVFGSAQDELFGNLIFLFFVDANIAPYVGTLDRKEFFAFTPQRLEWLDIETRSLVFDARPWDLASVPDFFIRKYGPRFTKCWTKSETLWAYSIWVAAADVYSITEEGDVPTLIQEHGALGQQMLDRPMHDVVGHDRHLRSGKTVPVRSHSRRNRLVEAGVPWDEFSDHVVYVAYDAEGEIRYIGEGRPDRPAHVNSGISHNYRINEHFFRRGKMCVEIIHSGLTKPSALAIERLAIRKHGANGLLWNIKDNVFVERPDSDDAGQQQNASTP
jgi:hypothetical protein